MGFFNINQENRVKCGKCGTEFDIYKNSDGCPLCGFGSKTIVPYGTSKQVVKEEPAKENNSVHEISFSSIPSLRLRPGKVKPTEESKVWGSYPMFNDMFSLKLLTRITALKMKDAEYVNLLNLVEISVAVIHNHGYFSLKGFPSKIREQNLQKDAAVGRLVNQILATGIDMGFFDSFSLEDSKDSWHKDWQKVGIRLTKQGLEFAQMKNQIFDDHKEEQIFYPEEKRWLVEYLKQIDKEGYKEYSALKEVYEFLKKGNNGNSDLFEWFENNPKYIEFVKGKSIRAKDNEKKLKEQISNYARSFASAKISLLRELGVVRDKRGDYTIIGEL